MEESSKVVYYELSTPYASTVIRQEDLLSFLMAVMHRSMSDSSDEVSRLTACYQIQRYWYQLNQEQRDLLLDSFDEHKMDAGEMWEDPSSKYYIWSKVYDWMGAHEVEKGTEGGPGPGGAK